MSYKIGARKPEPAAFAAAAAALSLAPSACAFIDDLGTLMRRNALLNRQLLHHLLICRSKFESCTSSGVFNCEDESQVPFDFVFFR
jgi:hypothetical protein